MKILLAIDDSKFSKAAVRMLIMQNRPDKTSVRILHVVEPIETPYYPELAPPYPRSFNDIKKNRMKEGRKLAASVAETLRAAGFTVQTSVLQGHARIMVVDVAAKWHANLIMMGSHGRKGLERLLLGSVSEHVVRHAPCSVQIVRASKRKD